jgi:hypothetical protein
MPNISIQVNRDEYPSLQVGDTAYYAGNVSSSAGFNIASQSNVVQIGQVKSIDNTTSLDDGTETTTITCEISESTVAPTTADFILFAKNFTPNVSSLAGYYASVKFKNDSPSRAELYAVSSEIHESSK